MILVFNTESKGIIMRCSSCQKFVSFDDSTEPEVTLDVDKENGNVFGEVRIVLTCAQCSTELKEAVFDVDVDVGGFTTAHLKESCVLDVECQSAEITQRTATVDRHGKHIKNFRYAKSYYGASVSFLVTCSCKEQDEFSWEDEIQASAMDEL